MVPYWGELIIRGRGITMPPHGSLFGWRHVTRPDYLSFGREGILDFSLGISISLVGCLGGLGRRKQS